MISRRDVVTAGMLGTLVTAGTAERAEGQAAPTNPGEAILREGRADLVALAREILYNPNWPLDAARKLGAEIGFDSIPPQGGWWLGKRAQSARGVTPSTFGPGIGGRGTNAA